MPAPIVTRRLPLLLGFLIAVGPVSVDMYLPAFPAISRQFHDLGAPQISLAAYFIGLAIGQMTMGALSDRLGRRGPLLAGLAIYTVASLGCAVCWSVGSFAVFRFLAALGASVGVVIPRAQVRDLAEGPAAAKLFSKLMLVMGVAPILAGSPQIFVGLYGWHTAQYALLFGVTATAYIGFNQLNPYLVSRYGIAPVITLASNFLLFCTMLQVLLAWHPLGPFAIIIVLLLGEVGFGLAMPSAMVGALSHHQAHAGSASALMGTLQYCGGALAALSIGAWAENSATPMAVVMLVCASLAVLAASLRPRVILARAETKNA